MGTASPLTIGKIQLHGPLDWLVFARGDVRSDALGGSTAWLVTSRSARDFIGWRP